MTGLGRDERSWRVLDASAVHVSSLSLRAHAMATAVPAATTQYGQAPKIKDQTRVQPSHGYTAPVTAATPFLNLGETRQRRGSMAVRASGKTPRAA